MKCCLRFVQTMTEAAGRQEGNRSQPIAELPRRRLSPLLTLTPWTFFVTAAVLIVAAGRGTRASIPDIGSSQKSQPKQSLPKQYAPLAGRPLLAHVVTAFDACPGIDAITVVIHEDDREAYEAAVAGLSDRLTPPVVGGPTRQASVRLGLESFKSRAPEHVLIHDAARPFITRKTVADILGALQSEAGAIAAVPLADTLKREQSNGLIADTVPRAGLWKAQTPQGFRYAAIADAHARAALEGNHAFTDDAAIAEWAGLNVVLVPDTSRNFKITTAEDLAMADELMTSTHAAFEPRNGSGFDVHAFCDGDHVWLAGVRIPHARGLLGHSDADAPLHALTDAVLGAIGDGDIGQHFPPSDPKWKGAASHLFVEDAARRVRELGGRITNVDITILCEEPRIGPHRDAMRSAVATMLGIDVSRVAVKATTTEQLGFTGRKEGIAAMATATVLLPL
jgi:2-C-methyl-D-erythritol 4-phosphate cytidylyltransferase / 2-C-methyl-D-erythritol 2,4-cyclodiphosphate synthase